MLMVHTEAGAAADMHAQGAVSAQAVFLTKDAGGTRLIS